MAAFRARLLVAGSRARRLDRIRGYRRPGRGSLPDSGQRRRSWRAGWNGIGWCLTTHDHEQEHERGEHDDHQHAADAEHAKRESPHGTPPHLGWALVPFAAMAPARRNNKARPATRQSASSELGSGRVLLERLEPRRRVVPTSTRRTHVQRRPLAPPACTRGYVFDWRVHDIPYCPPRSP